MLGVQRCRDVALPDPLDLTPMQAAVWPEVDQQPLPTILVVTRQNVCADVVPPYLPEQPQWRVLQCASVAAARSQSLPDTVDLIVVDNDLPDEDGHSVLHAIRQTWPQLPIILLFQDPDDQLRVRAQHYHVLALLHKPVSQALFVRTLCAALPA